MSNSENDTAKTQTKSVPGIVVGLLLVLVALLLIKYESSDNELAVLAILLLLSFGSAMVFASFHPIAMVAEGTIKIMGNEIPVAISGTVFLLILTTIGVFGVSFKAGYIGKTRDHEIVALIEALMNTDVEPETERLRDGITNLITNIGELQTTSKELEKTHATFRSIYFDDGNTWDDRQALLSAMFEIYSNAPFRINAFVSCNKTDIYPVDLSGVAKMKTDEATITGSLRPELVEDEAIEHENFEAELGESSAKMFGFSAFFPRPNQEGTQDWPIFLAELDLSPDGIDVTIFEQVNSVNDFCLSQRETPQPNDSENPAIDTTE